MKENTNDDDDDDDDELGPSVNTVAGKTDRVVNSRRFESEAD